MQARKRGYNPVDHQRWLVSYADFITLPFAFFPTLFAISNVDLQQMQSLVSALHLAFNSKDLHGAGPPAGFGLSWFVGLVVIAEDAESTMGLPRTARVASPRRRSRTQERYARAI